MRFPHCGYTCLFSSQESAGISISESESELSANQRLPAIGPGVGKLWPVAISDLLPALVNKVLLEYGHGYVLFSHSNSAVE